MDLDGHSLIVPVSATRYLQIAGGTPMVQSIPEEYVLASHILMLLNQGKREEIEFLLKTYLPIKLIPLSSTSCAFIDLLGIISTEIRLVPEDDAPLLLGELENSSSPQQIETLTKKMISLLKRIATAKSKSIVGLISGHHVDSLSQFLQWPTYASIESYSFVVPKGVNESNISIISEKLFRGYNMLLGLRDTTRAFDETLDRHITFISARETSSISKKLERLDERIHALEQEVSYLESREEQFVSKTSLTPESMNRLADIRRKLKSRRIALERDTNRRAQLREQVSTSTSSLLEVQRDLRETIKGIWIDIEKVRAEYDRIAAKCSVSIEDETEHILAIPLYIAGLSRKGQLRIEVFPPMPILEELERVSLRKDFIYPFANSKSPIERLARILSERLNSDISLRKYFREVSAEKNLLSLDVTRNLIVDGTNLLISDGLAKQSELEELEEFLSSIPEHRMPESVSPILKREGGCNVTFSVYDENGKPVEGAIIKVGALTIHTGASGKAEVPLPLSNYDGTVSARGYRTSTFDFTLRSNEDILIPIVLTELSHEEKLEEELQALVGKAERLDIIKAKLEEAFETHGDTLLQIPAYRNILVELLSSLGFDPQNWIAKAQRQRGMMQRLLRRDHREERIRRDILQIANESKEFGGIMLLSDLLVQIDELGWEVTPNDLEKLLEGMSKDGLIEGVSTLENGARIVRFIPVALTDDPKMLLSLAAKHDGRLTLEEAVVELNWTEERVRNTMQLLIEKGIAKVQKRFSTSTQYWFPSLRRNT